MIRCTRLLSIALVVVGQARAQRPAPRVIALPTPTAVLTAEFTGVGSVRELADGRTLIGDGADRKLLVGDWSTGTATQIGRVGSGPREYGQAGTFFALGGDSTLLPDRPNGRFLFLDGAAIVGTVRADAPPLVIGTRSILGADQRGNVMLTRPLARDTTSTIRATGPDSVLLVRVSRANGRSDTVAVLRARPSTISIKGPTSQPTMVSISMNPFAVGEMAALFLDGWIAVARLDPYRVEWIAPDGKRIRGGALPFEVVRLDDREIHAYLERVAERSGAKPQDPASFPNWPEVMPPFQSSLPLTPGPGGMLWIRRPLTAANTNTVYDVIDRRGQLVARVNAGKDVSVIGFGRNTVYTIATDDDGVQHLQRRPLPRLY